MYLDVGTAIPSTSMLYFSKNDFDKKYLRSRTEIA